MQVVAEKGYYLLSETDCNLVVGILNYAFKSVYKAPVSVHLQPWSAKIIVKAFNLRFVFFHFITSNMYAETQCKYVLNPNYFNNCLFCAIIIENTKQSKVLFLNWLILALLSAVFAALTSILAKVGIDGVNSNLATAIRTMVVLVMAWGMVFITDAQNGISSISKKSWIFLILSGLATGASWLCYYKALQLGDASKVVPVDKLSILFTMVFAFVFLHEKFNAKSIVGVVLIVAGTLLTVL